MRRALYAIALLWATLAPIAAPASILLLGVGDAPAAAGNFITFTGQANTTTSVANLFTFAATPIGTADANRKVMVCTSWLAAGNVTVTGVTVNAGAATNIVADTATTRGINCDFLALASGTTTAITVQMSGATTEVDIEVYSVVTTQSTYSARSGATAASATGTSLSIPSITVPASGGIVGFVRVTSSAATVAWAGATGTIDSNHRVGSSSVWVSAFSSFNTGAIALTPSWTPSVTVHGASVAWAP